ncbi:MAG TPA: aspartate dehydrogenase [Afifellaceae bacterium]|nr:aspartate dehydrogenase [Afifellaceae bacterium]
MADEHSKRPLRLAIAGLGAIGLELAWRIDAGEVPGVALAAVSARDPAKARGNLAGLARPPEVAPLAELAGRADVVVECAPAALFTEIAEPVLKAGKVLMPLSVGAVLDHPELVALAEESGGRIIVPTGALIGLDAVKAVARGTVHSVTLVTRKPPKGLVGAPYLVERGISVEGLTEPKRLFAGSAREAAQGFPANLNVAAALALAGIGADRTEVEIWADPSVKHNTHTVEVTSDSSDFTMTIRNTPTEENPRTGKITALSVLAALDRLTAPLVVGT